MGTRVSAGAVEQRRRRAYDQRALLEAAARDQVRAVSTYVAKLIVDDLRRE